jgi:hypothetical protein
MNEKNEINDNLKNGQFMLTPLECILINKRLPFGIKLETEDNILRSIDFVKSNELRIENLKKHIIKNLEKNNSIPNNHNINKNNNNQNNITQNIISNNNTNNNTNNTPYNNTINNINDKKFLNYNTKKNNHNYNNMDNNNTVIKKKRKYNVQNRNKDKRIDQKCQLCIDEIKKNPLARIFYNTSSILPSLTLIEKNIKNSKYNDYSELLKDLREVWEYYFQQNTLNPDIYNKTFQMSEIADKIYNKVNKMSFNIEKVHKINDFNLNDFTNKLNGLEKENNEYKGHNIYPNSSNYNIIHKNYILEKNMTYDEKNALGNAIRNLNKEQLKGIIKLLTDKGSECKNGNNQYFEFDIDKLSNRKLRELEKYVQSCNIINKTNVKENIDNSKQIVINNNTNIIDSKVQKNKIQESLLSYSESESIT